MRRYTTEALARPLPYDGDTADQSGHGSHLSSVYEHKPQEVCWPDNAPAGTIVFPLTPDRWEPLNATATGRVVLPLSAACSEGQTPRRVTGSIDGATDGDSDSTGMSALQPHQDQRFGDAPMHFRMALKTNAIGARKNAKLAKRQQFENSVLTDLAQLLGVAQRRLQITIEHSDDDDDIPLE